MWGCDIAFYGLAMLGFLAVGSNYKISKTDKDNITAGLGLAGLLSIIGMTIVYSYFRIFYAV